MNPLETTITIIQSRAKRHGKSRPFSLTMLRVNGKLIGPTNIKITIMCTNTPVRPRGQAKNMTICPATLSRKTKHHQGHPVKYSRLRLAPGNLVETCNRRTNSSPQGIDFVRTEHYPRLHLPLLRQYPMCLHCRQLRHPLPTAAAAAAVEATS